MIESMVRPLSDEKIATVPINIVLWVYITMEIWWGWQMPIKLIGVGYHVFRCWMLSLHGPKLYVHLVSPTCSCC